LVLEAVHRLPVHGDQGVGFALPTPLGAEEPVQGFLSHGRDGEGLHGPADVATHVAVLQPPDEEVVQGRPGHHAQLPLQSYGPGQRPPGHTDSHTPLDDLRKVLKFHTSPDLFGKASCKLAREGRLEQRQCYLCSEARADNATPV